MTAEKTNSGENITENRETIGKEDKFDEIKEKITNVLFALLIIATFIGSFKMFYIIEDFRKPIMESDPSYPFPSYSQLFQVVYWIPIMAVIFI